jgi:putative sterol carrier protein
MTAKEIIEVKIAKRLKENPDKAKSIGTAVAILLTGGGGGRWVIDCAKEPAQVRMDADSPVTTTISLAAADLEKMVSGELSPQTAFMTGKVKVEGNLGTAIKLGQLLT